MLSVRGLNVSIAGAIILEGVDLDVGASALTGLMGRNGAGKTTCMRAIMGLIPARAGSVDYDGADLKARPAHERARMGIGYMPEDRRLVPELTVRENVLVPAWAGRFDDAETRLAWIYGLMPEVESMATRKAMQLSGGQQKLVALARALMSGRKLLLLDEPFEGVAPALAHRLVEVLSNLKGEGLSVLLSESDSTHSADLIDALFVIERGRVHRK
jgi:branched-chain amino acid transport system ATP-binding protein